MRLYKQKKHYHYLSNFSSNFLFSIIIPVYNSEKHLVQCIQSILNQKYTNLEIILIDDCSTDESIKISRSFAKKYKNIKIIFNKKNEGVSACRNKGIRNATGKYIIFLDSDDYFLNNGLKKLANLIKDNNGVNLVIFTHFTMKAGNKFIKSRNIFFRNSLECKVNDLFKFYNNNFCYGYCWSYVFERKFIIKEKLQFLTGVRVGEDRLFVYRSLCCCKKFILYKKSLYCYRLGGALSLRKFKMSYVICVDYFKIIKEMYNVLIKKGSQKQKKVFLIKAIQHLLMELTPLLILISQNEIFKLSKIIQKNFKNSKLLEVVPQEKGLFFYIKKHGIHNGLINYKNFVIEKLKLIVSNLKFEKIYIFSIGIYGLATAKSLLKEGYSIKGFFDNNKKVCGSRRLGLKVLSPVFLKKKSKKELSKIYVIISNHEKATVHSIFTQLKKNGLKKKQIFRRLSYSFLK